MVILGSGADATDQPRTQTVVLSWCYNTMLALVTITPGTDCYGATERVVLTHLYHATDAGTESGLLSYAVGS
eukprot:1820577-Rhodomonas_salina.3